MNEDLKYEIDAAVKALKDGDIILYPTDTVWGLGCDATNGDAIQRIFDLKQRDDSKSVIVLVSDGDKYLLVRHAHRIQNIYACISGFVEAGETIEQMLIFSIFSTSLFRPGVPERKSCSSISPRKIA